MVVIEDYIDSILHRVNGIAFTRDDYNFYDTLTVDEKLEMIDELKRYDEKLQNEKGRMWRMKFVLSRQIGEYIERRVKEEIKTMDTIKATTDKYLNEDTQLMIKDFLYPDE